MIKSARHSCKERQSLEKGDITRAADASERGLLLFESATKAIVEEARAIKRIKLDAAAKDHLEKWIERVQLKAMNLAQFRMENYRMGIQMMAFFDQSPKQTH